MIYFSVIVPVYNAEKYVENSLRSIFSQAMPISTYEVLVVDDCSTDSTLDVVRQLQTEYPVSLRILRTEENSGPGIARNLGLNEASGEWIVFMDSDDRLSPDTLKTLYNYIKTNETNLDVVGINWKYDLSSDLIDGKNEGRYDLKSLSKSKIELLKDFVSLGMDGSVIYTVVRKKLITKNKIKFSTGYHEDVDFIFMVYYHSCKIGWLDKPLYIKNNRRGSIVNTITKKHIEGYFRAYKNILSFLQSEGIYYDLEKYYFMGVMGIVAVKVRDIYISAVEEKNANNLYITLYEKWLDILSLISDLSLTMPDTKYKMIANIFLKLMKSNSLSDLSVHHEMKKYLPSIMAKSWSCYDLHNSLFLASDEIRTCCKRFFVNGKRKGDVVILNAGINSSFTADDILREKRDLCTRINRGVCDECSGCPFLEFKEWGYIKKLEIESISLEYHSVCNMRCVYCNEIYYGGKKASYDINLLVDDLIKSGSLSKLKTVVWGGGEPVLDKSFAQLVQKISDNFPWIKQRIITNSTFFSQEIEDLLSKNKVTITTSIDAGTEEIFKEIKKNTGFFKIFENLKKYALARSENITIKYIIMGNNSSYDELLTFSKLIKDNGLLGCNFQISCDFTSANIDADLALSAIVLYGLLLDLNCRLIFFDELLRQRFPAITEEQIKYFKRELDIMGLRHAIADSAAYKSVIIWGAGIQTKTLIERSYFFKKVGIEFIVDSCISTSHKNLLGYEVHPPQKLLDSDLPVLISAVQNTPFIYDNFIELGLDKSRLIKEVVI